MQLGVLDRAEGFEDVGFARHWHHGSRTDFHYGVGRIPGMTAAELTPDEFAAAVAAVTTAFGDPTRREIYLFVRDARPTGVKAAEVAEQFALHPNVARHHLEKLAGGRLRRVSSWSRARDRRAGPSKRYRATERDTHLAFPPRRDDLLGTLLARALDASRPRRPTRSPKRSATSTAARSRRAWSRARATAR